MARNWKPVITAAAALAVLLVLAVWPASLGGSTSYVSTRGSSMEPGISQGDLVLVRQAGSYRVGDVIAYRSSTLGATVLHRIIDEDAEGFITKGDANNFVDPDRLPAATIIGRQWIHVPGGGRLVAGARIGVPLVVGGIFFLRSSKVKNRRGRRPAHLAPPTPRAASSLRSWRTITIASGAVVAVCVMTGFLAFSRPASATIADRLDYRQRGTFSYEAAAPDGPVYTDGRVQTGDPVFLQIVDKLDVTFEYDFESSGTQALKGTLGMKAVLSNAAGWRHEVTLQEPTPFEDDDSRAQVRLDVRKFQSVIAEVALATGMANPVAGVSIVPEVKIEGTIDGQILAEEFAPRLDFQLDALQLRQAELGDAATEMLSPLTAGMLTRTSQTPRHFTVLARSMPVATTRALAAGLGVPALVVAVAGLLVLRRRLEGEAARIELRHGHRIVPVTSKVADVIDVSSIQDLARMAEQYQALILQRDSDGGGQEYQMHADGVVYRYRTADERPTPSRLLG